jgi:linoleoyl-CoA desaturase
LSVANDHPAKTVLFTQRHGFKKVLTERVEAYIAENNVRVRDVPAMWVKGAIFIACWIGLYLLILLGGFPLWADAFLCLALGFAMGGIGLNIGHDANHYGYSESARINRVMSLSLELIGSSSFVWRGRHNVHHIYPNIGGRDEDLESGGLIRLSPHQEWKPYFRLQMWYVPLLYSLTAFDFLRRDTLVFCTGRTDKEHPYPKMTAWDRVILVGGKIFFFGYIVGVPLLFFAWWQVLIAFVIIMLTMGSITAGVSVPSHLVEAADFPDPGGEPLLIENEWAIHQVRATVDYGSGSRLLNAYLGGTNYQIEHHLFPRMSHVNYPRIAPIVRETCEEFGITYNVEPTMRSALLGHARTLRELGRKPGTASAMHVVTAR